ncbi:MAG: 16S rRNA (guanine(527)-N(7))-methyltransferase RsmG [Ahniella sp.]|nr:16S rRNA (guanine(527)-N(7))-methyltransferase RsmG [Ahniella sp.]
MSSPPQLARLRPRLSAGLETLNLALDEVAINRLIQYLELLVQWNQAYNLSAIREPDDMLGKHLFDALAMAPHWQSYQIADMGSGAGLPGVPLSICYPDRAVHVIESNGKKARFLRECKRQLKLDGLQVAECRAESFVSPSPMPTATARALAELDQLCAWCRPWLTEGGELLAMKGPAHEAELQSLPADFRHERTITLNVPEVVGDRFLVVLRRVAG